MKIGVFYHDTEKSDMIHAFEVLQNEARAFSISGGQISKSVLRFVDVTFEFINLTKDEKWKKPKAHFDKLFVSEMLKKEFGQVLKEKTENIQYVNCPTQGIVDYVNEIKQYAKMDIVIGYRRLNGDVAAEDVREYLIGKGTYFATYEECAKRWNITKKTEEEKVEKVEVAQKRVGRVIEGKPKVRRREKETVKS